MGATVHDRDQPEAVAVTPTATDWPAAFSLINKLLQAGQRVLLVAEPSTSGLVPGTFVIPLSRAFDPWLASAFRYDDVSSLALQHGVPLRALDDAANLVTIPARMLRIGLYGGGGAPYNHAAILSACGFPVRFLSDAEIRGGCLSDIDVFMMPGGGARSVMGQVDPLGPDGCRAIAGFVRQGGLYVGSCAGAYACIVHGDEFRERCPTQQHLRLLNARPAPSTTARGRFGFFSPGVGSVVLRNDQPGHPVMFGMPEEFEIVHYNGPVFEPTPAPVVDGASEFSALASLAGWTDRFTSSESFFGDAWRREDTYLGQSIAQERPAIIAGELGLGRVVAFGPHPEFGPDLPMAEWTSPARLLVNAVMWRCWSPEREPAPPNRLPPHSQSLPPGSSLDTLTPLLATLRQEVRALQRRSIEPAPQWLTPAYAMSAFGLPPAEIWANSLAEMDRMATTIEARAAQLRQRIAGHSSPFSPDHLEALAQIDRWVLDERAPEWQQDFGYQGTRSLLLAATRMCQAAADNWAIALERPTGAYDGLRQSPYHLVAGSYLAAIGHVAAAYHLLHAMTAVWETATKRADCGTVAGAAGA